MRVYEAEVIDDDVGSREALTDDERTMGMLVHLLALLTSWIGPLILWLIKKDESAFIDQHGRSALNFTITTTICMMVYAFGMLIGMLTFVLAFPAVLLGFLLILAHSICSLVFTILAAVAANRGEHYRYPLSIRFL